MIKNDIGLADIVGGCKKNTMLMQLKEIAIKFRKAMDTLKDNCDLEDFYPFRRFPTGACGETSEFFIFYLQDKYNLRANYWLGKFADGGNHAWAQVGHVCVDLTADQFNSNLLRLEPVIVCREDEYPLKEFLVEKKIGARPKLTSYNYHMYCKITAHLNEPSNISPHLHLL